ncbi:MAG: sugar ABC transporter permease [Epulopiscium sp.]|nr:sugar ABC transporter permease [Candidatus Epulonipiscium sp.]
MERVVEIKKQGLLEKKKKMSWRKIKDQRYLMLLSLPFAVWIVIFKYIPLWGWTMAFQDYTYASVDKPFWSQKWVGIKHFTALFNDNRFYLVLRNTLAMSFLKIAFGFIIPIIFAILLNELRVKKFKKAVQTISYLPHFVSWVIAAGIIIKMLSVDDGLINNILMFFNITKEPIQFMMKPKLFWWIVLASGIWKDTGWDSIIYLAAITGIDQELYEAAKVDGAGRFKQIWHITLPGIRPTVIVLLILTIGGMINIGFEQQFLLGNPAVEKYSEVLDLYALTYGINLGRISYGTAIGIFKSLVSITLLLSANAIAKRFGENQVI